MKPKRNHCYGHTPPNTKGAKTPNSGVERNTIRYTPFVPRPDQHVICCDVLSSARHVRAHTYAPPRARARAHTHTRARERRFSSWPVVRVQVVWLLRYGPTVGGASPSRCARRRRSSPGSVRDRNKMTIREQRQYIKTVQYSC